MAEKPKIYFWAPGRQRSIDPEIVGKTIDRIAQQNGGICHPQDLVDAARSPRNPLHPLFEWDDEAAAELYRRDQARQVIRIIRPVMADTGERASHPAYVHVNINGHDGYMRSDTARSQDDIWSEVLDGALQQLKGFEQRYRHLSELEPVWIAVKEVEKKSRKAVADRR